MSQNYRNKGQTPGAPVDVSVVVPVYRASDSIRELYERLRSVLESLALEFEILFIEDHGGDDSWEIIEDLSSQDARVRGIQLSRNFGQHAATICGFAHSRGNLVATIDDDLEQAPEDLSLLYEKAQEGHDLVYGVQQDRSHPEWRNFASKLARRLLKSAIPSLHHDYTSFRLLRGSLAREIPKFDSPYPFVDGYLTWLVHGYATVNLPHHPRQQGTSGYTFRKLLAHTTNIMVTYSIVPLRLAILMGLASICLGIAWLVLILLGNFFGWVTVTGFTSIMAAIILFGGIQLLILGIIGEYIGRMNLRYSKKPPFKVGSLTRGERNG